jgi:hypothetical protein
LLRHLEAAGFDAAPHRPQHVSDGLMELVSNPWDEEFAPSASARNTLRWALEMGASTLGEAYDMLEQLELSNDVPEILGHDETVDDVREELDLGLETVGPDAPLTTLL